MTPAALSQAPRGPDATQMEDAMKAIQQLEAAAARATGAERERILDRLADLYEADARRNEADNGQWFRNLPCGHQDHRLL